LISGLLIYTTNYIIGWGLYFKKITMTKRTHQFFFAGIIVNLILLLFFIPFLSQNFFICLASLAAMFVLPLGRKGGVYHRAVSTLGLMLYILILVF
jgi:hypothetical protein